MQISETGIELLKRFEGLSLEAYQDVAGIWTIGYGHTGPDVEPGMRITEAEADALLRQDLRFAEDAVTRLVSVPLNSNEFDALVSFVFNVGAEAFRGSTPRRRLNRGDRIGAADALTWWNKATIAGRLQEVLGLTRRRASERALFLTPSEPFRAAEPENPRENSRAIAIEAPPRRNSVAESRTVQGATVAGGAGIASSTMNNDGNTGDGSGASAKDNSPGGSSDTQDDDPSEVDADKSDSEDTTEEIIIDPVTGPTEREVAAVESQIQFALLILIVLAILFVIYARFDDWMHYRR